MHPLLMSSNGLGEDLDSRWILRRSVCPTSWVESSSPSFSQMVNQILNHLMKSPVKNLHAFLSTLHSRCPTRGFQSKLANYPQPLNNRKRKKTRNPIFNRLTRNSKIRSHRRKPDTVWTIYENNCALPVCMNSTGQLRIFTSVLFLQRRNWWIF